MREKNNDPFARGNSVRSLIALFELTQLEEAKCLYGAFILYILV